MDYELTPFEKEMETKLLEMKAEIQAKLSQTDEDFRAVVGSSAMGTKDSIDLATDDMATRKMEAVSQIDSNRLNAINQAIIRIKNHKYGVCAQCGKPIPEERLKAIPYALLCMNCKSQNEKGKR